MSPNDLWIAASAAQHGLTVVTLDGDFERIPQVLARKFAPANSPSANDATRIHHGRPGRRRGGPRAAATGPLPARALRRAAQPAAVPEADLEDEPRPDPGEPVLAPRAGAPARGHALRRQADHRRGGPPGAGGGGAGSLGDWLASGRLGHLGLLLAARVRPRGALRRARTDRLAGRVAARRAVHERHQRAPHGARGVARPRGLRGQRAAGPAGPRPPPDHGPHHAAEPALRPGPGRADRRQLRRWASSSTRRGSSPC